MRGTVNAPAGGKKQTIEDLNAQAKLTGSASQYVGFDEEGNAVAKNPLSGGESQYIGFDAEGKQIVKDLPENNDDGGIEVEGTEGQYVGFDKDGNLVAVDPPEIPDSGKAFFGTIGTEWEEDVETGVKSQLVKIEGVLASHESGVLDVIMTHERTSEGYAAFVEEQNQFLQFITNGDAETVDGGVMFYIYGGQNSVEIPFCLEVG